MRGYKFVGVGGSIMGKSLKDPKNTKCFMSQNERSPNFSIFLIQHWLDSSERHSDFEQLLVHPQKSAKKIVFVKTHKTASTTIQSILCRHALYNKLKVAVPKNGKNFFSYLEKPFIATQSKTQNPDVILFHMNFLQSEVEKLIPKNSESVFLTILRDIPDAFESRITYYKFKDKSNALPEIEDAKQLTAQVVNRYDAILRKINGTGTYHQQLRIILGNWYFYQFNQRSKVISNFAYFRTHIEVSYMDVSPPCFFGI